MTVKRHIRLAVIPEPEPNTRAVFIHTGNGTVIMSGGGGDVVFECGNCGSPLIEDATMHQYRNLVFKCNNCGEFNETLA